MQPTHAEVARTLAAGHLPATAHIACRPGPLPVRHVTDAQGRVLLLSPDATARSPPRCARSRRHRRHRAGARHRRRAAGGRRAVAGPGLGLRLGRPRSTGDEARAAALDYADIDAGRRPARRRRQPGAAPDGRRRGALRAQREARRRRPGRVRRGHARTRCAPIEFDLIADLADHHVEPR